MIEACEKWKHMCSHALHVLHCWSDNSKPLAPRAALTHDNKLIHQSVLNFVAFQCSTLRRQQQQWQWQFFCGGSSLHHDNDAFANDDVFSIWFGNCLCLGCWNPLPASLLPFFFVYIIVIFSCLNWLPWFSSGLLLRSTLIDYFRLLCKLYTKGNRQCLFSFFSWNNCFLYAYHLFYLWQL